MLFFNTKKKLSMPWKKYYSDSDLNIKIPDINMYDQIPVLPLPPESS